MNLSTPGATRSLWSIQYLRAVAVLMVIVHHLVHPSNQSLPAFANVNVGARGVDIFFVISGLIMYVAARDESFFSFWERRLTRIAPMYWLATLLMAAVKYYHRGFVASGTVLLTSVLFIPHYSEDAPNFIWPFLVPGWTLNYEMFFYLLFSIGILSRHVVVTTSALIATFVTAGLVLSPQQAAFRVYTDPLLLEFLGGLLLGRLRERTEFYRVRTLIWIGFAGLFASDLFGVGMRPLVGVSALAIVAGALGYEDRSAVPRLPFAKLLGDSSYSIYLVHPSLLWILSATVERFSSRGGGAIAAELALGLVGSVAAGVLVHLALERPLLAGLGRMLQLRRPAIA